MPPTRIAIATADGISVCDHLANSSAFLILEIEDGAITSGTYRTRPTDTFGSHAGFVEQLAGAHALVCGGIGAKAAEALAAGRIEPLILEEPCAIGEVVNRFLAGDLRFQPHLRQPVP